MGFFLEIRGEMIALAFSSAKELAQTINGPIFLMWINIVQCALHESDEGGYYDRWRDKIPKVVFFDLFGT